MVVAKSNAIIIIVVIAVLVGTVLTLSQQKPKIATSNPSETTRQENGNVVSVDEIGLTLAYPKELTFRKEIASNGEMIRSLGFYVEKGSPDNPTYQLYGLYQFDKEVTEEDIEMAKIGMDPGFIKETSIDGFKGFEGLMTGPKEHYATVVLKDGKLFSVSTWPPNEENKALTDQIIATFDFE